MKKYCVDMSGFSNPASEEYMPQDIYVSLWSRVHNLIIAGTIAVNAEIFDEMTHITGPLGECIKEHKKSLVLEIDAEDWDASGYLKHAVRMQNDHQKFIREFNGNSKGMIGLNDLSIIALGKALKLPVVSMEKRKSHQSATKRGIPDICDIESVPHLTFNDFLRAEVTCSPKFLHS